MPRGQFGGRCAGSRPIGPGLNLVKEWKLEEFVATMRTGTDPGGHELSEQMPWRPIGKMDDEELAAVYEYLIHLPDPLPTLPKPYGGHLRSRQER